MSWSLGEAMSWSKGGTEGFKNCSKRPPSFHFFGSEEKWAVQREICLFRSWYTLPRARNLKLIFLFQTTLARNSPAGTSELFPFGANSDLHRNCKLRRNCPDGTLELLPVGANLDIPWEWKFLEIPYLRLLFVFAGASELITFGSKSDLPWNCPAGTLELIPFGTSSDLLWDLKFLEFPSRGFLLAFPLLGFTLLIRLWGTTYFPVWVLLYFSFLGELHPLLVLDTIIQKYRKLDLERLQQE